MERFSEWLTEWAMGNRDCTADAHLPGEEAGGDKAGQPIVSPQCGFVAGLDSDEIGSPPDQQRPLL
jgi:hypothetical protein